MELFMTLGLKEVASIINTLGISTNIDYLKGTVESNGMMYTYEKKGNEITITSEDGKKVTVTISYKEQKGKDYMHRDVIYVKHVAIIDYLLGDGNHIVLSKDLSLDRGYESFENVQRHDLIQEARTMYCDKNGNKVADFSIGLGKICIKDSKKIYEFTEQGIVSNNRLITVDGGKLVSISGVQVADLDTVNSFDLEKERAIIADILRTREMHPFTREVLQDASRKLSQKERYAKDVIDYYNDDIKEVRRALEIRSSIIAGVEQGVIPPSVLESVGNIFRDEVIDSRRNGMRH